MLNSHIPPRILAALLHVREHIPSVDRVVFWDDGRWLFTDWEHHVTPFGDWIDDDILMEMIDEIPGPLLPVAYQLEDHDCQLGIGTYKGEFYAEYSYTWGDADCIFTMLCEVAQDLIPEFEQILKREGWKIDGQVTFSAPPWLADRLVKIEPQENESDIP